MHVAAKKTLCAPWLLLNAFFFRRFKFKSLDGIHQLFTNSIFMLSLKLSFTNFFLNYSVELICC
jgi:hypothetical protein